MRTALIGLLLLSPLSALAAGFASQSIFVSTTTIVDGATVRIHATLSNDAAQSFAGKVMLQDGTQDIGSVDVTLPAGGAEAISANWTPRGAGVHTVTADLMTQDGIVVQETTANFPVAAKPAPGAPTSTAVVESSAQIQSGIQEYVPQVAPLTDSALTSIDGFRASAAQFLNSQLNATKASLESRVLGTSTQQTSGSATDQVFSILKTIYLYLLTILLFVINKAAVFYPVAVLIFFYILWRIFRRIRRPSY